MSKYPRVAALVYEQPWAVLPSVLSAIVELVELRLEGGRLAPAEIEARLVVAAEAAGPRDGARQTGLVAVLPIYGLLSHRMNLFSQVSGGTSVQGLRVAFRAALDDPQVGAIVFDVDSPGGMVDGIVELAEEIRAARGQKPIVAVANTLMASAAYWLSAQADEIVASPSSFVGAIGIVAMHTDLSEMAAKEGVKTTLVSAGRYKTEGNELEPLGDEARAHIQTLVDDHYALFTDAIAKARGISARTVREGYGEGRVLSAGRARTEGMIDRIATLEATVQRFTKRLSTGRPLRAQITSSWPPGGTFASDATSTNEYLVPANLVEVAGPIAPHSSPAIADDDAEWDASAEVAAAEGETELRRMHVWVDDEGDPDAKSSYKGPHHRADGTLVPKGLFALSARFDQLDIPASDDAGCKAHMARHYRELDRTPPWEADEGAAAEWELERVRAEADRRKRTF